MVADIEQVPSSPRKQFSRKRKNTCWTYFCSSGGPNEPTERAQLKSCWIEIDVTVDGGGHVWRTNTLLLRRGMRTRLSFVVIWPARPKIMHGPKHEFLPINRNGTNVHEQPRSVPSSCTRSNRVKTRPQGHTRYFDRGNKTAFSGTVVVLREPRSAANHHHFLHHTATYTMVPRCRRRAP